MTPPPEMGEIRLLLLDVDGVLTDGCVTYDAAGGETKSFSVKDGLGLRLAMGAGLLVGVVTGRNAPALDARLKDLDISLVYQGVKDKAALLPEILEKTGVRARHTAFVGDDLPDLPIMNKVGWPIAVADAAAEVKAISRWTTRSPGGKGAVREVCEAVLKGGGGWDGILARFQ